MKDRKSLTKSLHTVSAVVNVAQHMLAHRHVPAGDCGLAVRSALEVLGQPGPWAEGDEVVAQCVRVLFKKLGG